MDRAVGLDPFGSLRFTGATLGARQLEEAGGHSAAVAVSLGCEWLVDAYGCAPESLRSREILQAVFAEVVAELDLHPAAEPLWHVFPEPGGVTGLLLLRESHLACHTFPERGFAAFNLYCCRPRPEWAWSERLRRLIGAECVAVRRLERGET